MSELVENPEDRFSRVAAHLIPVVLVLQRKSSFDWDTKIQIEQNVHIDSGREQSRI